MTAMPIATPTLRGLVAFADDDQTAHRVAALASNSAVTALAGTVSAAAGPARWQQALRDLADAIPDLLQVDLGSVVAAAWKTHSELGRFTDASQYGPDETILVELTTHVVISRHTPHLDLLVNDQPCGRLDFTVEIALRLEGVVLTITGGKICRATTGSCTASSRIVCAGQRLSVRQSVPVLLPGTLVFDQPIPIATQPGGWEETALR